MKRCKRTVWKTMLVLFSTFSCLLQWMGRYFKEMCGNSQPQARHLLGYQLYKKWNTCLEKHEAWRGAMVWPHRALVKIWECFPYVIIHAFHKLNHHRGSSMLSKGKSSRLKGNPNFLRSLPWSFFLGRTYTLQITMFKFGIFSGSFTIFRGLCAFSRH